MATHPDQVDREHKRMLADTCKSSRHHVDVKRNVIAEPLVVDLLFYGDEGRF